MFRGCEDKDAPEQRGKNRNGIPDDGGKMNYKIEYMDFGNGNRMPCAVFEDDNGVLGVFVNGDIREFHDSIRQQVEQVLFEKRKSIESFGNECSWLIRPDFTFVRDNYALDDNSREMMIDTQELRLLIDDWVAKTGAREGLLS